MFLQIILVKAEMQKEITKEREGERYVFEKREDITKM